MLQHSFHQCAISPISSHALALCTTGHSAPLHALQGAAHKSPVLLGPRKQQGEEDEERDEGRETLEETYMLSATPNKLQEDV